MSITHSLLLQLKLSSSCDSVAVAIVNVSVTQLGMTVNVLVAMELGNISNYTSDIAIYGVLSQIQDGHKWSVAAESIKKNYSTIEHEAVALVDVVKVTHR